MAEFRVSFPPVSRSGLGCLVFVACSLGVAETRAGPDARPTAVIVVGADATAERAAVTVRALLEDRVDGVDGLRRVRGEADASVRARWERARAALAAGRRAYDELALEDARRSLLEAIELYRRTADAAEAPSELVDGLALLGATEVLRGAPDAAEALFVELLTLDPIHRFEGHPPFVTEVFERAASRIDAAPGASLEVISIPPHASVRIDGRFEGVTPLTVEELVAGEHHLLLDKAGFASQGRFVELSPGAQPTVQLRLVPIETDEQTVELKRASLAELAAEDPRPLSSSRALATRMAAEVLIGVTVTRSGPDTLLVGAVFDAQGDRRVAVERAAIALDLDRPSVALGRFLDRVVDHAASPAPPDSSSRESTAPPASAGPMSSPMGLVTVEPSTPAEVYLGWTLVGIGGAALVTGGVFAGLAQSTYDEFRDTAQSDPGRRDLQDRGRLQATTADVLFASGGAILVGGALLVLLTERFDRSPVDGEGWSLGPTTDGGMVGWRGVF